MSCRLLAISALVALAQAQGVILSAVGDSGKSLPLQVDLTNSDANVINATEIAKNMVNECGRTLLGGNIDIGENTEEQLSAKTVTSVSKGGKVAVTIAQGSADGAGPYSCDLDLSSNGDGTSGQTKLAVAETDNGDGTTSLALTLPSDLACFGASTGNVCTVRCVNNATAGPYGGCFAVQQTDVAASQNQPATIKTAQTLEGINAQIAVDKADLPTTLDAISTAGGTEKEQGVALVDALLDIDSTAAATVAVADVSATAAAAASSATSATGNTGKTGSTGKAGKGHKKGGAGGGAAAGAAAGGAGAAGGAAAGAGAGAGFGAAAGAGFGAGAGAGAGARQGKNNGNKFNNFNKRAMRWGKRSMV